MASARRSRAVLAATVCVAVLAGCSHGGGVDPDAWASRDPSAFTRQDVEVLLSLDGQSTEQLAILERAASTGEVAFDDYQEAVMATIACLEEAGLSPRDVETDATHGQPVITYVTGSKPGISEAANDQLIDGCTQANSASVEQLYARNPGAAALSVEAQNAHFAQAVTACLTQGGYDVSEAEGHTWRDLAGKIIYEQTDNATATCILETGLAEEGISLPLPDGA